MENISTSQPSYLLHLPGSSTAYSDTDIDDQSSYLLWWSERRKLNFVVKPLTSHLPNKMAMCFLESVE
jgi:hypothetical protein